jgi:hypothetical protein
MYLFSRRRLVNPAHLRAGIAFSVDIARRVSQVAGFELRPWTIVHSRDVGTVVWSGMVPDLASLETASDKLLADAGIFDAVESNDHLFLGPPQDALLAIVHGTPNVDRPVEYVTIVSGQVAPGSMAAGIGDAIEIAEKVTATSEGTCLLATNVVDEPDRLTWLVGSSSIGEVERGRAALNADPEWLPLIDRNAAHFQPGFTSTLLRRLA